MKHDPTLIKPNADYHDKRKPAILIAPAASRPPKNPPKRRWKVSQYVPLVKEGIAGNGSQAVAMLDLSWLPGNANPGKCLAWARAFCEAVQGGLQAREAADAVNKVVK